MTTVVTTKITNVSSNISVVGRNTCFPSGIPGFPVAVLTCRGLMSSTESTRFQTETAKVGRIGLIDSCCASGQNDSLMQFAAAIINKRAGGPGLIVGHRIFHRPMHEGVQLLNLIQDVYLSDEVVYRIVSCDTSSRYDRSLSLLIKY